MALTKTATLRVPSELRDVIARIAAHRGSTMVEVVAEAVQRLNRDDWWTTVRAGFDSMNTDEAAAYQREAMGLANTTDVRRCDDWDSDLGSKPAG
jgi:predicted transcriptional regulator